MDIAKRFECNPLLGPSDIKPSIEGAIVEGAFNPGVYLYEGKTYILMRVAERMPQEEGFISTMVADETQPGGVRIVKWDINDPKLDVSDPRFIYYDGHCHLTTLSHLRMAGVRS